MSAVLSGRPSALDPNRRVGSVCAVFPNRLHVNLGDAAARTRTSLYGEPLGTGQVGEFVLIGSDQHVVIGRVTAIRLVERERLSINPSLGEQPSVDPIGEVDLLASLDRVSGDVVPGIESHPRLGCLVYAPAPQLMSQLVARQRGGLPSVVLDLGVASGMPDARVKVTPERLFGRHCAILGATGGGKSFTIAKLIEESAKANGKAILIDATGEFYTLAGDAEHVSLGRPLHGESEVHLPFAALEEQDLYGLFQPSGKVQGPKLREAIYSLRIAHILAATTDPGLIKIRDALTAAGMLKGGLLMKEGCLRKPFEDAVTALRSDIEAPNAQFDISLLAAQIGHECCWQNDFRKAGHFGGHEDSSDAWCSPLVARINAVIGSAELRVFFNLIGDSLLDRIDSFLTGPNRTLRISLASIPYSFNAREIVANSLGRRLLALARAGVFKLKPTVVFLDEAHNFLNRRIGDEDAIVRLDAFDQIAKEGRKHWLTISLATQRPRDLPEGVLSQMGTMVVHRLINHRDREVVERACGDIDRASVAFLPTLAPGQAAIIGVDFPFPLTVSMDKPTKAPDSEGPNYQSFWK